MKTEDGYGNSLDDLTGEEIQELKDDGLLPPDFKPGDLPPGDFNPGPAESGGPLPPPALPERSQSMDETMPGAEAAASGATGGLGAVSEEGAPAMEGGLGAIMPGAMAASGQPEGGLPPPPSPVVTGKQVMQQLTAPHIDPMAQRFNEIALNWLPTDDKDMKTARAQAEAAAKQLSALREAAEAKAKEFPWAEWSGALGASGSPRFMQTLGEATLAAAKTTREREANAQHMGLEDVNSQFNAAKDIEGSAERRISTGAQLAQAAAHLQRATNVGATGGMGGAQPAVIKEVTAMGFTPGTPEFETELARQTGAANMKGDQAYKRTLNALPGVHPKEPEFVAHYAEEQRKEAQGKTDLITQKGVQKEKDAAARSVISRSNMDYKAKLTREAQAARDSTDGLSPDTVKMLAQQAWAGDKSGIAGFGRNKKARAQIAEGINEEGRRLGKSGADLAAMNAEFAGATRAQTALGTRIGATAGAVEEANGLIPSLLDIHRKIKGMTDYPMLNQATLWTLRNTPIAGKQAQADAAVLDSRLNTFASVYARGMYGGTPTVDMLKHSRDVIDNRMATMSFEDVLKAMTQEMQVAMAAPGKASKSLSEGRKAAGEPHAESIKDPLGIR